MQLLSFATYYSVQLGRLGWWSRIFSPAAHPLGGMRLQAHTTTQAALFTHHHPRAGLPVRLLAPMPDSRYSLAHHRRNMCRDLRR